MQVWPGSFPCVPSKIPDGLYPDMLCLNGLDGHKFA